MLSALRKYGIQNVRGLTNEPHERIRAVAEMEYVSSSGKAFKLQ